MLRCLSPTHIGYAAVPEPKGLKKQPTVMCHFKTGYILRNASWGQAVWVLTAPILNSGHWAI